jgi:hypothetical protein
MAVVEAISATCPGIDALRGVLRPCERRARLIGQAVSGWRAGGRPPRSRSRRR